MQISVFNDHCDDMLGDGVKAQVVSLPQLLGTISRSYNSFDDRRDFTHFLSKTTRVRTDKTNARS